MDRKNFIRKALSPWVWINITLMTAIVVGLIMGIWNIMEAYTIHGEKAEVPKVKGMTIENARYTLTKSRLKLQVMDSTYNKKLPEGMVMKQVPEPGKVVKPGRAIELTINTHASPTVPCPDIINNCSKREAEQRLESMGLKLTDHEYIAGQKDYVLGLKSEGKLVKAGDRIKTEKEVTLVLGSGTKDGHVDTLDTKKPQTKDQKLLDLEFDEDAEDEIVEEIL